MKTTPLHLETKKGGFKVAIVYRIHTEKAVKAASAVASFLKKQGIEVLTAPEQKKIPGTELMKSAREFQKVSLAVVLGGDGTYLRAVRLMQTYQTPILGFNMGTLGYLAHHSPDKLNDTILKALKSGMCKQDRARVQVLAYHKGSKKPQVFHALNDVVLERGSHSQLIHIAIRLNDDEVHDVKADGLILATPTGSTAYNLAAGGPILDPEAHAFVITPVAPHSLTHRPLVVADEKTIIFRMESYKAVAHLVVDGQKVLDLKSGDELHFQKADIDHQLVVVKNHNDFKLLRKKLLFGHRT
jgi:NAD+ kinase